MKTVLLAFICLTLGGCVTMDASECRSANWYEIGFRDGLFGMQRMDVAYDEQCSKQGAKPDIVAYAKGWQEGLWEFDARKAHGGVE
jgi:hypothetical protein